MADAAFAAGSQGASPVSRAERPSARPSGSSSAQSADFSRSLNQGQGESGSSSLRLFPGQGANAAQPGRGLLGNGVSFLLAQTRTQEASAPLPPVSNFERAKNRYLETQSKIKDTIAANSILRGEADVAADAEEASAQSQIYDDDVEEAQPGRVQYGSGSLI
ncbi:MULTISPECIES: hypothetical protein [Kordiimonas]|jgi:hypothetical protein|uniref:hypothetical protein n=1 Tax=Kordiimonas TaxID=288021 RepID=UPI0011137FF7|nr:MULTISPECIES: hypothetical protein [Kordiimonas]